MAMIGLKTNQIHGRVPKSAVIFGSLKIPSLTLTKKNYMGHICQNYM